MTIFLTVIHVVVCFVLILVILLQAGRGQGLAGPSFASGNVQSLFGTRAADFLTKATSVSAICFLFTCVGLDFIESRKSRSLLEMPRQNVPLDMDTIKKALEKVKAEGKDAGGAAQATAEKTAESGAFAANEAKDTVKTTAANAAASVDPSKSSDGKQPASS